MNPQLRELRAQASFPIRTLTHLLNEGEENTLLKERISRLLDENPIFDKSDECFLNHEQLYEKALNKSVEFIKFVLRNGLTAEEGKIAYTLIDSWLPTSLHLGMFMPTLASQGTKDQVNKWYPLAQTFQIIGTYAQTELGHGTALKAIETTATYDKATQEFVLNTPTITSMKWWPGGLGKTANHCVLMARLIVDKKDYGVHSFIVQLRSLEDHKPLPGITVGDIGPKFGFNTVDNGFLKLDGVRIPREQMLMKFAKVLPDGTYEKPPHEKVAYGTMIFIRANLVTNSAIHLERAVTIALRYSAVRKQGFLVSKQQEHALLDYKTQQHRLIPLLATAYAIHFSGKYMRDLYAKLTDEMQQGIFDRLPELHATAAGLKAVSTSLAADGIEECRKCCGGHGYSQFSGLPQLFADNVAACTYEGDNIVLLQQTARRLIKLVKGMQQGKVATGNVAFLQTMHNREASASFIFQSTDLLNPEFQKRLLIRWFQKLVAETSQRFADRMSAGQTFGEAWNALQVPLCKMAEAHCYYIMAKGFLSNVNQAPRELQPILKQLCDLFVLRIIHRNRADFLVDGFFGSQHIQFLQDQIDNLVDTITPQAIPLVDAFGFSDMYLNSALGRYDGNVYEALVKRAQGEPLNKTDVNPGYERHLRQLTTGDIWSKL